MSDNSIKMGKNPFANALFSSPPPTLGSMLFDEKVRRRTAWNERFAHWEKPASVSEEGTIECAWRHVAAAVANNSWLADQAVVIAPQGSYHNNTNVRQEADIDLRAVHPFLKVEYAEGVVRQYADGHFSYTGAGRTFGEVFSDVRVELTDALSRRFGSSNVDTAGKKAIRIKGITGSRAEVDVVPALNFHYITWVSAASRYDRLEGVAILSTDGMWTFNFPDQHTANGISKRARTGNRFKRVVRIMKRMRSEMTDRQLLSIKVPSFLIECLVHVVEDRYFLVESDDRYGRVRRVAGRIQQLLADAGTVVNLREINNIKSLFWPGQAWTLQGAQAFANAAVSYLGDD